MLINLKRRKGAHHKPQVVRLTSVTDLLLIRQTTGCLCFFLLSVDVLYCEQKKKQNSPL